MTTRTIVTAIDGCGRSDPETYDLLDAADALGLTFDDVEHILDIFADGSPSAFIGEIEYRLAAVTA